MTDEEARLLDDFRKLNPKGQAKLLSDANLFTQLNEYRDEYTDEEKVEKIKSRLYETSKFRYFRESGNGPKLKKFSNELTRLREKQYTDITKAFERYEEQGKEILKLLMQVGKMIGLMDNYGDREIFDMYYVDGLTDQQIADKLNMSRECVNHRRKKMAEIVERDIDDIIR